MELAYDLVTGKTPFDADKVLDDVIVLLVPTSNPDGHQMECDWYTKNLGTKYEGGNMPWLYHPYAGHDNNRDWFMFNLSETKAVTKVLYHDWFPQIHIDEHQMGSDDARLFIPPFMNPPVPNVQPLVWRGVNLLGVQHGLRPPEERLQGRRPRPELHGLVDRGLRRHVLAPQHDRPPQRNGLGQAGHPHLHRADRDLPRPTPRSAWSSPTPGRAAGGGCGTSSTTS